MGLGFGVHADDDDQWNEAIVGDDLGLFHGPSAPLLEALCSGFLLRGGLGTLDGSLALALQ